MAVLSLLGQPLTALLIGLLLSCVLLKSDNKIVEFSERISEGIVSAAPILLITDIGRTLTVMAIGAGAMTVSHANDSFFWVVSRFSR